MPLEEVRTAISWAQEEGWNPGHGDAAAFYAADASGFLAGKHHDEIVATISAVKYGTAFGFIGLYIVAPAFRGRGFGLSLWEEAMARLEGRNIGLDGVLAQQDNYRKSGFQLAHRNVRYAGKSVRAAGADRTVAIDGIAFSDLLKYDERFFPAERSAFLKHWIHADNSTTLAVVDGSRIRGYGSVRACHQGFKIGPLNADDAETAEALFRALSASVPEGADIFLDVPEPNRNAIKLALKYGMAPVFETARMYTRRFPDLPLDSIFGITSFELG